MSSKHPTPRRLSRRVGRGVRGLLVAAALLECGSAAAQTLPERFLDLVRVSGVSGHEDEVRDATRAQMPPWAQPKVDEIGNLIVTVGSGSPHVALVASLDEGGYVVSRITDDGFLRLHKHTLPASHRLGDQFFVGQPVLVRTSTGKRVPGVTATLPVHFDSLIDPVELSRVRSIDDLWVDVGAATAADAERLGIRLLDVVSLRESAQPLADGRVAGVAARSRAGAQTLVEIVRGFPSAPAVTGTITLAWVTQTEFGARGLARLAQEIRPDRVYLTAPALAREYPAGWEEATIDVKPVPVLFPETPVEVVDTRDIASLARELAALAGLSPTAPTDLRTTTVIKSVSAASPPPSASFAMLKPLVEVSGVSGHEAAVRNAVLSMLPSWASPQVDEKGNVTIAFGTGGEELLFLAHMDEVGFEVAGLREDGSAGIRIQGGVFLSLYEAHPVIVDTPRGPVPAVLSPRREYATATTSQPDVDQVSLYFGTTSPAETRALGVAEGQPVSVRKQFVELSNERGTGMSLDDRAGVSVLLLALQRIDPAKVRNRVTFAWTVEEETSLGGASALAARLRPRYAFAIDTFVSTDGPLLPQRLGYARLGAGAVLRGLDTRTLVRSDTIDRIVSLARAARVPLQIGATQGSTDAALFSAGGAIDVGLSWPGRYSHSPVEVIDRRDLDSLARLVAVLAQQF